MTISPAFYGATTGVVDASEPPDFTRRHAVIAVAHGTANKQRTIMMRNSWGSAWGNGGYAWLSENYLLPRIFALAILKEDLSVPVNSAAA
jgi:aminopeptidase C